MACLKCTKQSKHEIYHPSSGINCEIVMANHQRFEKQQEWELTNVGLQEQCPVPAENTNSLLEGKSVSEVLHSTFSYIKSRFQSDEEVWTSSLLLFLLSWSCVSCHVTLMYTVRHVTIKVFINIVKSILRMSSIVDKGNAAPLFSFSCSFMHLKARDFEGYELNAFNPDF